MVNNSALKRPIAEQIRMQSMIETNPPNEEVLSQQEVFGILVHSSTYYFRKELFWLPLVKRFSHYLQKEALPTEMYELIFDKPVN